MYDITTYKHIIKYIQPVDEQYLYIGEWSFIHWDLNTQYVRIIMGWISMTMVEIIMSRQEEWMNIKFGVFTQIRNLKDEIWDFDQGMLEVGLDLAE